MPDPTGPDFLAELESFTTPGLRMDPLPAAEVRRRGARRRRRNITLAAAGGVLAVAVIATPVALIAGHQSSSEPQPAPNVPTTRTWQRTIPTALDLTALPADATFSFTAQDEPGVDDLTFCGVPGFSTSSEDPAGPAVDSAGAAYGEAGTESIAARTLALYSDDGVAASAFDGLQQRIQSCPTDDNARGTRLVNEIVPTPAADADASFVFTNQAKDGDLLADLTVIQVVRTGNAIYLATSHTSAGGDQVAAGEIERLAEQSAPVLSQLCAFAAAGCGSTPDGSAEETAIPADWLRGGWSGPGEGRERQVVTYGTADAAKAYSKRSTT